MKNLFIDILAFGTLFSSVLVITSKNPVIAVTFFELESQMRQSWRGWWVMSRLWICLESTKRNNRR